MMMPDNKKKAASMIVASMSAPKAVDVAPEMESDSKSVVAEEIMAAFEAKDSNALSEALKSFVHMCMDEYGSESSEVE